MKLQTFALLLAILAASSNAEYTRGGEASRELKRKGAGKPGEPAETFPFLNAQGEAIGKNCKTASVEHLCDTIWEVLTSEDNLGLTLSDGWCGCKWDVSACVPIQGKECKDRRDLL